MLKILVKSGEVYNEQTQEFEKLNKDIEINLEHSLVSLSKWESKWHKPFLNNKDNKTNEELLDYIRCMTISQNIPEEAYYLISKENLKDIMAYIEDPMTATTFSNNRPQQQNAPKKQERMTSELIYYWMIVNEIPMECQKWHLNRLLTLIRLCGIKNNGKNGNMSKKDIYSQNRALNEARRAKYHTNG